MDMIIKKEQSFFGLQNILFLAIYLLNKNSFLIILNNSFANLCKSIHDVIIISVLLTLWIWKLWKGREKTEENWMSRERKERLRWNKKYFWTFLKYLFSAKYKEIENTSFKNSFQEKCQNIYSKEPVLGSCFWWSCTLWVCNVIKKSLRYKWVLQNFSEQVCTRARVNGCF